MPLTTLPTLLSTATDDVRTDGPELPSMVHESPAGAQPVFTRLSAFIRTFVRSKEPAAVAG